MAALGLIFGLMLIVKLGREQGLDPDKLWNLGIIAILSGIVGAKILMILVDLGYYRDHPAEIFSLSTFRAGGVWSGRSKFTKGWRGDSGRTRHPFSFGISGNGSWNSS